LMTIVLVYTSLRQRHHYVMGVVKRKYFIFHANLSVILESTCI
jgi:hypothetical protein